MFRGRPKKAPGEGKKKYNSVSNVDRARIVEVYRRGGDLKLLAETLGINVKTARSIAATDRCTAKKRGGSSRKFDEAVVHALTEIVENNPSFTLSQIRSSLSETMPDVEISVSSIDRLLDGHGYSLKLATRRPVERNSPDVKEKRREYAEWLQNEGTTVSRYYIDETNFNVWCARSFARAKRGAPAVKLVTGTRGANINILLCMSANGIVHWSIADKVHWAGFNEFLEEASQQAHEQDPDGEAVFIFDNAPAHRRAEVAALAVSQHTIQRLPPYSPFFNPTEEVFSKFKFNVKAYLEEHRPALLNASAGVTKKQHRRSMLVNAAKEAMQNISRVECAAYDRHNFSFVRAAVNMENM